VHTTDVVERPADLTVEWLTLALGVPVSDFGFERIGTGQMSECYRVGLTYADGDDGPGPTPRARGNTLAGLGEVSAVVVEVVAT
jgi:hypothetical protein